MLTGSCVPGTELGSWEQDEHRQAGAPSSWLAQAGPESGTARADPRPVLCDGVDGCEGRAVLSSHACCPGLAPVPPGWVSPSGESAAASLPAGWPPAAWQVIFPLFRLLYQPWRQGGRLCLHGGSERDVGLQSEPVRARHSLRSIRPCRIGDV